MIKKNYWAIISIVAIAVIFANMLYGGSKEIDFLREIYSVNKNNRYIIFDKSMTKDEFTQEVLDKAVTKYYSGFKSYCTKDVIGNLSSNRIPMSLDAYCLNYEKQLEIGDIAVEKTVENSKDWTVELSVLGKDGSEEKSVVQKGQLRLNDKGMVEYIIFYNMKNIGSSQE